MLEEERKNILLIKHWEYIKGSRNLPSEDDIETDKLADIWDNCFLIQFRDIDSVESCNYTYLGQNVINAYENQRIPFSVAGLVNLDAVHLREEFRQVRENVSPMISKGDHKVPDGYIIRYHQCLLPLSFDNNIVHSIIGRMGFEIYPN